MPAADVGGVGDPVACGVALPGGVTIMDSESATARSCPRHAVVALDGITGAYVDWTDSKGLNEWERKALELPEERSKLSALW